MAGWRGWTKEEEAMGAETISDPCRKKASREDLLRGREGHEVPATNEAARTARSGLLA